MITRFENAFNLRKTQKEIQRKFDAKVAGALRVRTAFSSSELLPFDIRISREKDQYLIETSNFVTEKVNRYPIRIYAATPLYWYHLSGAYDQSMTCNISDGHEASGAEFAFSSYDPKVSNIPDPFFYRELGYRAFRDFAKENPVAWLDRSDEIFWRGGLNGAGLVALSAEMRAHPFIKQRIRMATECQVLGIDFKFTNEQLGVNKKAIRQAGLFGGVMDPFSWNNRKFAIDIDGQTNAWCNGLKRMHMGCCVLKVASDFGYRQWYYDKLLPWQHYVPVAADLSDLAERVDWIRANDDQAREIAAAGQALAQNLTWESESKRAGRIVAQRINLR